MIKNIALGLLAALLACPLQAAAPAAKVDLNTATSSQLESLPGIGPALAQRILEFREKNGRFKRIEDLMNVRGIGEKKFEQLRDRISVGAPPPVAPPAKPPGKPDVKP